MSSGVHIEFAIQVRPKNRKTEIWSVIANGHLLGEVRWWPSWRRYTFHPCEDTVYDKNCLQRIADFCGEQTWDRKKAPCSLIFVCCAKLNIWKPPLSVRIGPSQPMKR